jgi:hypothetical protein
VYVHASYGIRRERVMTGNGSGYGSTARGRKRWVTRWKPALNASALIRRPHQSQDRLAPPAADTPLM